MATAQTCPDMASLDLLVSGEIPEGEIPALEKHLEECDRCFETFRSILGKDTLLNGLTGGRTGVQEGPRKKLIDSHMRRLCQLQGPALEATVGLSPAAPANPPLEATQEVYDFLAPPQGPGEIGRLGGYRVLKVLGVGGMGVVFQAEDVQLQRPVALKAMKPALATNPAAKQRFLREARAAAALKHDHIVTIYQVGEDQGVPFLAMELLDGQPLDGWLTQERKPSVPEILRVGREIAHGLAAAHGKGLTHRDIKPGNIWLDQASGRVKILDFGLARAADDTSHLTQSGMIVGTPAYMAPEQARGEAVDQRGDLFSLGCVLYRLCTGRLPFRGETTMAVLTALALDKPQPIRGLNPDVPQELADLVLQLLAKDQAQRPASADQVAHTLTEIERRLTQAGNGRRTSRTPGRWRWPLAIAAGILLLVGGGLLMPQIILKITGKDGTVREVPLNPGDEIKVVEKDPKPAPPVAPRPNPLATGSPFDSLDPKNIAPADLALAGGSDAAKSKIVAFLGPNQLKDWTMVGPAVASPDGKILAVVGDMGRSQDHYVRLWDVVSGKELRTVTVPGGFGMGGFRSLAFAPDGKTLAVVGWQKIHYLNAATGKEERTLPLDVGKGVNRFDFSPDGKQVAFKTQAGELKLLDLATGKERLLYQENKLGFVAFSPDGKTLLCGRQAPQGQAFLLDVAAGKVLRTLPVRDVRGGAFRPDGKQLALVVGKFDRLQLWDMEGNRALDSFPLALPDPAVTQHIAYAPDGRHVILATGRVGVYVLRLDDQGPLAQKQPPAPQKPFVVVRASGPREEIQTLNGAIAVLGDNDVIEVHGNGPFPVGHVQLKNKALTLRAAAGYRPQFVVSAAVTSRLPWFDLQGGPVRIEGCEFRCPSHVIAFNGGGAAWEFQRCRLLKMIQEGIGAGSIANKSAAVVYAGPRLGFADCLISALNGPASAVVSVGPRAELDMSNSLVRSASPNFLWLEAPGGQTVRLRHNTFVSTRNLLGVPAVTEPVQVEAIGNLFALGDSGHLITSGALAQKDVPAQVRWHGQANLYAGAEPLLLQSDGRNWSTAFDLAGWNRFWGRDEEGSRRVPQVFFAWEAVRLSDSPTALQILERTTEDMRQEAGLNELGPNWALLGPGEAYVRALAAAGQPTGRPEPLESGPFVIVRAGKAVAGYPTLQQALNAAANDDVLEIRTNGPFAGAQRNRTAEPRLLTVRAAPGYRPVLEGRLSLNAGDSGTVEGIHFRKGGFDLGVSGPKGRLVRLANCAFEQYEPPDDLRLATVMARCENSDGKPVEIVNCLVPGALILNVEADQKLVIRNSALGCLRLPNFKDAGHVELDHCVLWNPATGVKIVKVDAPTTPNAFTAGPGLSLSATACLFETGGNLCADISAWTGAGNLFRVGQRNWINRNVNSWVISLEEWQKQWKTDADSATADPADYDPRQWQLLPQSPGKGQGPDGKDFGADVIHVARPASDTGQR
jgi:serine/threonine protein kinase